MASVMYQGVEKWKNLLLVLFKTTQIGYRTKEGRYGNGLGSMGGGEFTAGFARVGSTNDTNL